MASSDEFLPPFLTMSLRVTIRHTCTVLVMSICPHHCTTSYLLTKFQFTVGPMVCIALYKILSSFLCRFPFHPHKHHSRQTQPFSLDFLRQSVLAVSSSYTCQLSWTFISTMKRIPLNPGTLFLVV